MIPRRNLRDRGRIPPSVQIPEQTIHGAHTLSKRRVPDAHAVEEFSENYPEAMKTVADESLIGRMTPDESLLQIIAGIGGAGVCQPNVPDEFG